MEKINTLLNNDSICSNSSELLFVKSTLDLNQAKLIDVPDSMFIEAASCGDMVQVLLIGSIRKGYLLNENTEKYT